MSFCRKCGSELPHDAMFCPRCGTAVAAAEATPAPAASAPPRSVPPAPVPAAPIPPAPVPPAAQAARPVAPVPPPPPSAASAVRAQPARRAAWWIAPAAVVGLVLLAWVLLAVLPLDRDEPRAAATATTETISEAEPQQTSTMIEVPPGTTDDSFEIATTTIDAPPMAPGPATATAAPPVTATGPVNTTATPPPMTSSTPGAPVQRPPVIVTQTQPSAPRTQPPAPRAQPPATQTQPPPTRVVPPPQSAATISEGEAAATLRSYVRSSRYYPVAAECVRIESRGYRNVGYNMEVWHSCAGGGSSRLLGRWRVDAKTREVFVQRDNGRYQRP